MPASRTVRKWVRDHEDEIDELTTIAGPIGVDEEEIGDEIDEESSSEEDLEDEINDTFSSVGVLLEERRQIMLSQLRSKVGGKCQRIGGKC